MPRCRLGSDWTVTVVVALRDDGEHFFEGSSKRRKAEVRGRTAEFCSRSDDFSEMKAMRNGRVSFLFGGREK